MKKHDRGPVRDGAGIGVAGVGGSVCGEFDPGHREQPRSQPCKVILNKVGDAPLSACTVASLRPGRDVTTVVVEPDADGPVREGALHHGVRRREVLTMEEVRRQPSVCGPAGGSHRYVTSGTTQRTARTDGIASSQR
jgi:hypothetical protein